MLTYRNRQFIGPSGRILTTFNVTGLVPYFRIQGNTPATMTALLMMTTTSLTGSQVQVVRNDWYPVPYIYRTCHGNCMHAFHGARGNGRWPASYSCV
jgi:hypothetical protein